MTVPPLWELYHYILIKPSHFVKTWCENTYTNYLHQQKNNRKDSFHNKQYGLYNVVLGEGEEIFLQKITSIDFTTMDLMWNSKISTYAALVKSATQESTGFFLYKKKKNITKINRSRRKEKAVKKFKPIYYFNISIKSDKHRFLLNLPKLFLRHWSDLTVYQRKTSRWTSEIMM